MCVYVCMCFSAFYVLKMRTFSKSALRDAMNSLKRCIDRIFRHAFLLFLFSFLYILFIFIRNCFFFLSFMFFDFSVLQDSFDFFYWIFFYLRFLLFIFNLSLISRIFHFLQRHCYPLHHKEIRHSKCMVLCA